MKKRFSRSTFLFFLALIIIGLVSHIFIKNISNLGPLAKTKTVLIEKGATLKTIARKLETEGFLDKPNLFLVTAKMLRKESKLQAGEIRIPAHASILEIITLLSNAKSVQYRLTIPEGLTTYQVLQLVENETNLSGNITIKVTEGELLPETYLYSKGDSRNRIVERMQEAMKVALDNLWEERCENLPYQTKEEALIMASIIEKETSIPSEYDVVAGVFVNRLNKKMRLQTDPTVIYALSEGKGSLGRALLRRDLSVDHPYNTYRIYGLPPGPICNPGIRAIKAALNPGKTDYIYFVADGSGGHAFARTLTEHNQNVANWRDFRRQRRNNIKQQAIAQKATAKPSTEGLDVDEEQIYLETDDDIDSEEIEELAIGETIDDAKKDANDDAAIEETKAILDNEEPAVSD